MRGSLRYAPVLRRRRSAYATKRLRGAAASPGLPRPGPNAIVSSHRRLVCHRLKDPIMNITAVSGGRRQPQPRAGGRYPPRKPFLLLLLLLARSRLSGSC